MWLHDACVGGKELQVLGSACMPSPQYKSPLPQNPPDEQHVPPVHVAWAAGPHLSADKGGIRTFVDSGNIGWRSTPEASRSV